MHVLGKILTWSLFPIGIAAMALLSRNMQVRNSYTEKIDKLKKQNAATAKQIAKQEQELDRLNRDYEMLVYGWDRHWDSKAKGRWDAAGPTFSVNGVGTANGVGKKVTVQAAAGQQEVTRREMVHIFYRGRGNASYYVGPFELVAAAAKQFTAKPMWTLQPNERATWLAPNAPSRDVRIRPTVPVRYPTEFANLYTKLQDVDQELAKASANEAAADAQQKSAKADVTRYRDILFGRNGGLVKQLATAEEGRNAVLATVDALRRKLKQLVDLRDKLAAGLKAQPATSGGTEVAPIVAGE